MIGAVLAWYAADQGDAQAGNVGEVGLGRFARMELGKDHLTARPVLRPPGGDLRVQRAELALMVATGMLLLQQPDRVVACNAGSRSS